MWLQVSFLCLASCWSWAMGTSYVTVDSHALVEQMEMIDLLDLGDRPQRLARPAELHNSASKFLLEVYNEISEQQEPQEVLQQRHKRSLDDDILVTPEDRQEMASCNSILTFASRPMARQEEEEKEEDEFSHDQDMYITFNTNDVPLDLYLMQAMLRIYKLPSSRDTQSPNLTVSVYRQIRSHQLEPETTPVYRILNSVNTTVHFKGWLEFNLTHTLRNWLLLNRSPERRVLRISLGRTELSAAVAGLVAPQDTSESNLAPFIVGYFNGPELLVKVQKLRFKRELHKRKSSQHQHQRLPPPPPPVNLYKLPQACERLNFTVDFKELQMHNWVIAPKKFEAYFCGGGCNFPLGTKMNATNHAIVQTLMHLKQPHLPKPCCVPTELGSITILRYINEDIIDLTKYQKAVAKECGCH